MIGRGEMQFMIKSYDVSHVCMIVFVPVSSSSNMLLTSRFTAGWSAGSSKDAEEEEGGTNNQPASNSLTLHQHTHRPYHNHLL